MISISNVPDWITEEEFIKQSANIAKSLLPGGAFMGRMALPLYSVSKALSNSGLEVDEIFNEELKNFERSSWWGVVAAGFAPSQEQARKA